MTGHSHSDGGIGEKFGLEIMKRMNDKCEKWKNEENIDYSIYGTPLESTTYKFAKCLKKRFGNDVFEKLTARTEITLQTAIIFLYLKKLTPLTNFVLKQNSKNLVQEEQ